jgi:anthranilate synthase component I
LVVRKIRTMMSELEFKSLVQQGYNRIPLLLEGLCRPGDPAFSVLEALPMHRTVVAHSFLLESVVGGERFGRYSFIGLPAAP